MDISPYKKDFERVLEEFKKELSQLVIHRASPSLVEDISIDYYGSPAPIKNIAAISAPDAHTLIIKPWESKFIQPIEKAITQSPLNLNPVSEKDAVRISLPPLSGERISNLEKLIGKKTEEARIKIRQVRDDVWKEIQRAEKNKEVGKDEKFQLKDGLEEMVGEINKKIAQLHDKKIKELSL